MAPKRNGRCLLSGNQSEIRGKRQPRKPYERIPQGGKVHFILNTLFIKVEIMEIMKNSKILNGALNLVLNFNEIGYF